MALFWQIVVFLLLAAALGFVIGWLTRGARAQGERTSAIAPRDGTETALVDERDRLRTELAAAQDAQRQLEDSLVQLRGLADTRASRLHELEQAGASSRERIARLEQELSEARGAGDRQHDSEQTALPAAPPESAGAVPPPVEPVRGTPPPALPSPEGQPDDLKQISGIGPSIEKTLNELGIYHFRQIAQFTPDNVAWIDQRLRFRGRIEREDWIGQARQLAVGESVDRV